MPAQHSNHDVVVIGGGPGGYAAALYGASAGLNVAIVEREKVGGTCLHRGCVPAKEFLETAHVHRTLQHADEFGFTTGDGHDGLRRQPAAQAGGRRHACSRGCRGCSRAARSRSCTGTGRLRKDRTVEILDGEDAGSILTAPSVILAAGSVPRTLPGFEVDGTLVLTSDEFLDLSALPATRGGDRRRGDRLRVRLAARGPRASR